MIGSIEWPTRDLLSVRASTTPAATAIVSVDAEADGSAGSGDGATTESWTYAAFDRRVDGVAAGLENAVFGPDCDHDAEARLGVLVGTRVAFAAVYFAAMRRGVTVAPLNVRETADELRSKADRLDLDGLVCSSTTAELATEITDGPIVSVDDSGHDAVDSLRPDRVTDLQPVELERDRTHLLMFTSGTTGEPKAVRLTVGNLLASAIGSAFRLGVLPDDRWLCCLPMYHMGGLAPLVRSTLYGTTTVIQRSFDPEETARIIETNGITGVSLVPTMCRRLLEAGWTPPETLRFVLLGGAPASRDLIERCRDRGVPVHPTYGMTETASQIATARPADAVERPGTVGRALVTTDVSIVDEEGNPVGTGEVGEVVVSGPTVSPGYLDDDRTVSAVDERGLHTGDMASRDESGRLWVHDRRSDRIVTGGENVDPDEVREALRSHSAVAEAAVVGLADEEWGERVSALVVLESSRRSTGENARERRAIESILEHCKERLASFKRPKTVGFAGSIPRTPSGTVDRDLVRRRLLADGVDVTGPG
ncbi:2-succinylbenzoate--CoA ligase [Natrarchaeobius halalkaliphilus]|uniref:2-succinylbenzoate--CoA ligase n=1 Tax=Natrarchaeobius halalkaliphilus TaxID=1679091 RepID=A0A3N6M259_9EURY|nr:AMP-binding protein [Natrarchaeobius halalkaliphilus]RQG89880.1 2-succinylbenzoate--CoA ligase [Natrarchaeobius halalkaliphilus]